MAERVDIRTVSLRERVLHALQISPDPLTAGQIATRLNISRNAAVKARAELIRNGTYPPSQRVRESLDRVREIRV